MAQPLDHRILANQNLNVLAPDVRGLLLNMEPPHIFGGFRV